MRRIPGSLIALVVALSLTPAASAAWKQIIHHPFTSTIFPPSAYVTPCSQGEATGQMRGAGSILAGWAYARAGTRRNDQASVVVTGFVNEHVVWKHLPPGVGEVELTKEVFLKGSADLVRGPCSAVVLGSALATTWFDAQKDELRQDLTRSSGATSNETLGTIILGANIPIGGIQGIFQLQIPMVIPTQLGIYPQSGPPDRRTLIQCPVTVYERDLRVLGWMRCFGRRDGESGGWLCGSAKMISELLLTHPQCP